MRDFEIGEFLIIPEFKISDSSNSLADRFVECDDSAVHAGVSDVKEVDDVLSIA